MVKLASLSLGWLVPNMTGSPEDHMTADEAEAEATGIVDSSMSSL